jgi:hypothetical protein
VDVQKASQEVVIETTESEKVCAAENKTEVQEESNECTEIESEQIKEDDSRKDLKPEDKAIISEEKALLANLEETKLEPAEGFKDEAPSKESPAPEELIPDTEIVGENEVEDSLENDKDYTTTV